MSKLGGVKLGGKLFAKILKRVPLIGPLIEGFFTNSDIQELISKHMSDPQKYTEQMLYDDIGGRISEGLGGMLGAAGGATIGGILGSVVPVAGNALGAIGGGVLGDLAGRQVGKFLGQAMGETKGEVGRSARAPDLFISTPDFNSNSLLTDRTTYSLSPAISIASQFFEVA